MLIRLIGTTKVTQNHNLVPYSSSTGLNLTPTNVAKRTRAVEMTIIIFPVPNMKNQLDN